MRPSDLDYDLPSELIAQKPLPRREASRLLLVDVDAAQVGAGVDLDAAVQGHQVERAHGGVQGGDPTAD